MFLSLSEKGLSEQYDRMADQLNRQKIKIAVLPFANYTGREKTRRVIQAALLSELEKNSFQVVPSDKLRSSLRKFRIRSTSGVSSEEAFFLRKELGCKYLLAGSYDVFAEGEIPEIAFSIRIIHIPNMRIVWASAVGGTGTDFIRLFGLGRITSSEELAAKLCQEAFKDFGNYNFVDYAEKKVLTQTTRIAIVPFDNLTKTQNAGHIFSAVLLSQLFNKGSYITETGLILDLFRKNNKSPRGGIDYDLLGFLHDEYDVDFVITGTVDQFRIASTGSQRATPSLSVGARVIDCNSLEIISSADYSSNGSDYEKLFGLGAIRSSGKLSQKIADKFLDKFYSDREKEIEKENKHSKQ